jgi:hypothetical protein
VMPKAEALSTRERWASVGSYSAVTLRFQSLNQGTRHQRDRLCGLTDKKLDKKGGGDGKVSEESLESGVGLRLGQHARRRYNQLSING